MVFDGKSETGFHYHISSFFPMYQLFAYIVNISPLLTFSKRPNFGGVKYIHISTKSANFAKRQSFCPSFAPILSRILIP